MNKKPFIPEKLPINISDKDKIQILYKQMEAIARITYFNTLLDQSPIKSSLLLIFSLKESVESSRIEGTQASIQEVVEAEVTGEINNDIIEIKNYRKALNHAINLLNSTPISTRLFHELHSILLDGSRGSNRNPGKYRTVQNFIGPSQDIREASYIPPEPQLVNELMSNLEEYINDDKVDKELGVLGKVAVIHGQFETIHPYLDGNGRLGRILIIIYLVASDLINTPMFFVSEELEKNKFKYYKLLNDLRTDDPKWKEWILFFIESSKNQANNYIQKLEEIENIYQYYINFAKDNNIKTDTINFIFENPIFKIKTMEEYLNISYNTARRYTNILEKSSIVYGDDKQRNRNFYNYELLNLM